MSQSETQEQILDAVLSVMMRDGVRGASMRSMAKEADVSLGLLSYHFEGKDALIAAAFERATSQILDRSLEALETVVDSDERVRAYLRGAFSPEFLDDDYLKLRISLWAVSRTDENLAEVESGFYNRYADPLAELIEAARPNLSESDVVGRVTDVIVISNGLWLNWARFHNKADLKRGLALAENVALA